MVNRLLKASFFIATASACMLAGAQNVYKCGSSYSQTPCAAGTVVDVSDPRTAAQKAQTDAATLRDARVADALERSRLSQEARDRAASKAAAVRAKPPASAVQVRPAPVRHRATRKQPEYFTATTPDGKKAAHPARKPQPGDASQR